MQRQLIVISNRILLVTPMQSGTVGNPKGVMLSHDNVTWNAKAIGDRLPDMVVGNEILISYLPLSHIAAQVINYIIDFISIDAVRMKFG